MSGHNLEQGSCYISSSENNFLTEFSGHAVVSLNRETTWSLKLYGDPQASSPTFIFVIGGAEPDSTKGVLTLDKDCESKDAVNILIRPVEDPPSEDQLWIFEDAIMQPRFPPIFLGRIQSAAKPELSAAIGGHIPLPRLYLNVAAVPNDPESVTQRWKLDYLLPAAVEKD